MKTTKWFRKRMVLALVVFICGIALMGLVYIVNNKPYVYINPGIVTSAPTTTTRPIESVRASRQLKPYLPAHMNSYTRSHRSFGLSIPSVPMRGMYETSRAKVQHVGSGTNGVYATTGSSSRSSSQRGIQYGASSGVVMPMTTFTSMASARQVAQPEAQQAPQMARMAAAPRFAPGPPPPPNPGGGELPGDHQLVEQPVGEGFWILLLMAAGYIGFNYRKRTQRARP